MKSRFNGLILIAIGGVALDLGGTFYQYPGGASKSSYFEEHFFTYKDQGEGG